jgi:hypothetical protein
MRLKKNAKHPLMLLIVEDYLFWLKELQKVTLPTLMTLLMLDNVHFNIHLLKIGCFSMKFA